MFFSSVFILLIYNWFIIFIHITHSLRRVVRFLQDKNKTNKTKQIYFRAPFFIVELSPSFFAVCKFTHRIESHYHQPNASLARSLPNRRRKPNDKNVYFPAGMEKCTHQKGRGKTNPDASTGTVDLNQHRRTDLKMRIPSTGIPDIVRRVCLGDVFFLFVSFLCY